MKKVWKFMLLMSFHDVAIFSNRTSVVLKYITDQDNNCVVLYGWTDNKDIAKEFKQIRSDRLIMMKIEICDEDFTAFKREYSLQKISEYKLKHYIKNELKDVNVLMTKDEFSVINEYSLELINESVSECTKVSYRALNNEYIQALDTLLYTYYHDIFNPETEDISDTAEFYASYNQTPLGQSTTDLEDTVDQLNLFVSVFKEVIEG